MALKKTYDKGYLNSVTNPSGRRQPVYIAQGVTNNSGKFLKSNWQAYDKGHKIVGYGKNAEKLAIRLAKKGHKKVTFRD